MRRSPVERDALADANFKGSTIGLHGLFQPRRAALALTEGQECASEAVLRRRPLERDALAGANLKNFAVDLDGLFQLCGAALALTKDLKCVSEVVFCRRPVERDPCGVRTSRAAR